MLVKGATDKITSVTNMVDGLVQRGYNCFVSTRLPLDKIAASSQTIFSGAFSWMNRFFILINISLKFVPKGPIDNNPALV